MFRMFAGILVIGGLMACATLEERMAKRTGCDAKTVTVLNTSSSPIHKNYLVKCGKEKKEFLCTDSSVHRSCSEKTGDAASDAKKG